MPHLPTATIGAPRHRLEETSTASRIIRALLGCITVFASAPPTLAEPADVTPVAALEVPGPTFVPLPTPTATSGAASTSERTHRIRPGDTLWDLARAELSSEAAPADIARATEQWHQANPGVEPRQLIPGSLLYLPQPDQKDRMP